MNVTVQRKLLLSTITRLRRFAGRVSILDAARVCFQGDDETLTLSAMNGTAWGVANIPASGEHDHGDEIDVGVPLDTLRAVVAASDAENVQIRTGSKGMFVDDDKGSTRLLTFRDLPAFPGWQKVESHTVRLGALGQAIDGVRFAAAPESNRYAIDGICWDGASLVATNGRVLAAANGLPEVPNAWIMPQAFADAVADLARAMPETDAVVYASDSWVVIDTNDWTIGSTLVEGVFAPWRSVIPEAGAITATLDCETTKRLLRSALTVAPPDSRAVRFRLGGGTIVATTRDATIGEAKSSMQCETEGEIEIGVNGAQFIAALDAAPSELVRMQCIAPNKPIVLSADGWQTVVMPMTLG